MLTGRTDQGGLAAFLRLIERKAPDARADSRTLDDVAAYLARHGVSISATITRRFAGSVSEGLAAIAGEKGADLIVAGGYGHGRVSEWIWGGVTRDLLGLCPLCCLLSH